MQAKAGVEFQGCIREGYACNCRGCGTLQRFKCECIAEQDLGYGDDPHNAEIEHLGYEEDEYE